MNEISGTWLDRRTGKTVIVRDAVMDGDQMVIMSSIGAIPPDVFSTYFVQMSEEDYGSAGLTPEVSGDAMLAAINNGLSEDEKITKTETLLDKPIVNNTIQTISTNSQVKTEQKSEENNISQNTAIIKKVFDKMEIEPMITFSVNIDEWPINELKMLVNTLDIPFEDISDYVITNYLNKHTLIECFNKYLQGAFEN